MSFRRAGGGSVPAVSLVISSGPEWQDSTIPGYAPSLQAEAFPKSMSVQQLKENMCSL